jgi:uncharacterized protein DUF3761/uncharacterized protein DUF732
MFRAALTSIVIAVAAIAAVPVAGAIFIVAAAPTATADECGPGYYWSTSHQTCVESPDGSTSNVTAICRDGSDLHSLTHSGTCSGHGGVAQWCPCGSAAAAPASSSEVFDGADIPGYLHDLDESHITYSPDGAVSDGMQICNLTAAGADFPTVEQKAVSLTGVPPPHVADVIVAALVFLCDGVPDNGVFKQAAAMED